MRILLMSGLLLLMVSACAFFEEFDPSEISRIRHEQIDIEDTTGVLENDDYESLGVYYINESNLPYVDISDYIRFYNALDVSPAITHAITNGRIILHQDQPFESIDETLRRTMVINSNTNVLRFNDPLFATNDEMFSEFMYFQGTKVNGYVVESSFTEIALEPYNFFIHEDRGNYYMPLHLVNLFIMPEFYNLYYHPKLISLVHTRTISDLEYDDLDMYVPNDLRDASYNFLKLLMEYRYGLTHLNDSWDEAFEAYETMMMDEDLHYRGVRKFLLTLDEMHTGGVNNGYYKTSVDYTKEINSVEASNIREFMNYHTERSEYCEQFVFSYETLKDDTYLVNIPTMNIAIIDDFNAFLIDLEENPSTIILDLRCNVGGELRSAAELLALIASNDVTMERVYGDKDYHIKTSITSKATFDFIDYYALTSPITYSAANIIARTMQDQELGKIIGENTAGGSGGQFFTSLPSGKPIVYTSPLTFVTQDHHSYEPALEVDYPLAFDEENYYHELLNIIKQD